MSILVFGKTGQLARELARHEGAICLGRDQADLSDPAACAALIRKQGPTAVINAAAYTAVDQAEAEEMLATRINAEAPAAMATACADLDIPFVTLSTDYVFDGSGTDPWQPDDKTGAINAYGRSKAKGEALVTEAGGRSVILRVSWVVSAHGNNFVKTMLRLGAERDALNIVDDQIGAPTPARDIADTCIEIVEQLRRDAGKAGIYHYAGAPETSWACFACETFKISNVSCAITGIPTTDYPTPAQRPLNSRLDCSTTEAVFGLSQPDWRKGLQEILQDLETLT
ncbi:dTDP-4-dehydrorhamnose reductase [Epibacterium ulvae]|uniref:dTDP-4-dehydrorhamnose reductase n=1 Tax=Epibacterium ulvae TaxID=1156985 RepID=UPI0024919646|nr:dTDP-4-dehydrorhamnose reductase [Epibacterium ulvae]